MNTLITAALVATFVTPNGAIIDWYGNLIQPAPIVQTVKKPLTVSVSGCHIRPKLPCKK